MRRLKHSGIPLLPIFLGGLLGAFPDPAKAMEKFAPTESEALLLPPYCQAWLFPGRFPQSKGDWSSLEGVGMLQYCYALNFINRARAVVGETPEKKFYLVAAAGSLQDVIARNGDQHILAPEFHIGLGDVLVLQHQDAEAEREYSRATEIRPDYPKGWLMLSDLHKQAGRVDQARSALESGLKASPEKYKEYLRKRLSELQMPGGATPRPVEPEKAGAE